MPETTIQPEAASGAAGGLGLEQRVLVLAPFRNDAAVVCRVLSQAGFEAAACPGVEELCAAIGEGAAAVLVAEEALSGEARGRLTAVLVDQPAWSDLPLLVMASHVHEEGDGWRALRGMEGTAHLALLDRPLRAATLVSAVGAAVESRRRQYQIRDELAARRRAEQDLRASEALYRSLAANLPGGAAFILDRDLRYVLAEGRALAAAGYTSADFEGRTVREALDAQTAQHYAPLFRQAFRGEPFHYEHQSHGRHYRSEGVPIRDAQGDVTSVLVVSYDISERKRVEDALRQSREDLARAQAVGRIGSWRMDVRHNLLTWSDENYRIFGISPETPLTYETFLEAVHPDDRRHVDAKWNAALGGQPYDIEHRIVVDGATRWVREKAYLEYDDAGNLCGGFGITQEITDRKQTEEALQKLNATLAERVAERTAVAERRARDLRRLAAELSEAEHRERTRLAKLLHDDLQQLLLAVKLRLPVLAGADRKRLKQHVKRLDDLVAECLSTSRNLTQELSPPIIQHGGLPEVVEWLGRWFADKHGLHVAVEAEADCSKCAAAPEHLRVFLFQAVRELLMNVVKHSGQMEARVDVVCRRGDLTVQVEDRGDGFDPQTVEARLHQPEGFGLFNIRERLQALGGRLEIRSAPEGGACFRLVVRAAEEPESLVDDSQLEGATMEPPAARKPRTDDDVVRLLVADDHGVVREGLVGLLDLHPDVEVVGEAADGEEAVRQAEALQPDAIVMDVEMPNVDGIEAARRIKRRQPEVMIIALSLHDERGVVRRMQRAGADAYVSKHVPAKELVDAIRRICHRDPDAP